MPKTDYDTFVKYLSIMNIEAINLLNELNEYERKYILNDFFPSYYGSLKEHYWSITKLFRHAMYIPMFLQIGKSNFSELIYIDTHSGPGLARIGPKSNEIVLGSPLIALQWPQIIAKNVKNFRSIKDGFTKLYFIEKSPRTYGVLYTLKKKLDYHNKAETKFGDANDILPKITVSENGLVYIFMDPYGKLDTQIRIEALARFLSQNNRADIMISLFTTNIARGISELKDPEKRIDRVFELLGDGFCDLRCAPDSLCREGAKITSNDILEAYTCALTNLGLNVIKPMPVNFEKGTLYYTVLATTHKEAKWMQGYINYIEEKSPMDYNILKNLWMKASGKIIPLDHWNKKSRSEL